MGSKTIRQTRIRMRENAASLSNESSLHTYTLRSQQPEIRVASADSTIPVTQYSLSPADRTPLLPVRVVTGDR